MQLMKFARAVLGGYLFELLMKSTFYGHFVAGENRHTIVPKLERFFLFSFNFLLHLNSISFKLISILCQILVIQTHYFMCKLVSIAITYIHLLSVFCELVEQRMYNTILQCHICTFLQSEEQLK